LHASFETDYKNRTDGGGDEGSADPRTTGNNRPVASLHYRRAFSVGKYQMAIASTGIIQTNRVIHTTMSDGMPASHRPSQEEGRQLMRAFYNILSESRRKAIIKLALESEAENTNERLD
jgi:hypothetical protein